jgi:hypothetical protein
MQNYRRFLESVMAFEPPVHVFGGVAEDALLHGAVVRPHEDLDVLVGRDTLQRQLDNAHAIGFGSVEVRFQPIEGVPVVIGTTDGHMDLEISAYDLTAEGGVFFHMVDDEDRLLRVQLSEGVFDHPMSLLDGVPIRTVSPLALYQIRTGIEMAGGFGPLRPKDIAAQEGLHARFFPNATVESLRPTLTYVTTDP